MKDTNSIAWWRNYRKVSQVELAKFLHINRALLSQIETGIVLPSDDILIKMSRYLNCLTTDLLKENDDK